MRHSKVPEVSEAIRRLTNEATLRAIGSDIAKLRALVVGDVILDRWIIGRATRISPEAPVPIVHAYRRRSSLGGAANVARNLRAMGAQVALIGALGRDRYSAQVKRLLERVGIEDMTFNSRGRPTTVKTRIVADTNHQICRVDWETTRSLTDEELSMVRERIELAGYVDLIIISDYSKGIVTSGLIEMLKDRGVPIYAGLKPSNARLYSGLEFASMNRDEFIATYSQLFSETIKEEARNLTNNFYRALPLERRLREELDLKEMMVTKGARGMTLITDEISYLVPSLARSVSDVTGAGDTVLAFYSITRYVTGEPLLSALIATLAAGIAVSKFGTEVVSWKELIENAVSLRSKDRDRLGKVEVISGVPQGTG